MKKFRRKSGHLVTQLSEAEVELLTSMVEQLVDLVSDGEPADFRTAEPAADPFEQWSRELAADPDVTEPGDDPVLRRLFPDAYADDPEAAADFRRFTERDLKTTKVGEAAVVLAGLEATRYGRHELRIPVEDAEIWLRTLNSLRLAVAVRLGITDSSVAEELAEIPDDEPRAFMSSVYDWLSFAQETLISAL
jgi:Domain of unknown function (DUF2017)